jgi:hypothetical protein
VVVGDWGLVVSSQHPPATSHYPRSSRRSHAKFAFFHAPREGLFTFNIQGPNIITSLRITCPVAHLTGQARKLSGKSLNYLGKLMKIFLFFFSGAHLAAPRASKMGRLGGKGRSVFQWDAHEVPPRRFL